MKDQMSSRVERDRKACRVLCQGTSIEHIVLVYPGTAAAAAQICTV